MKIKNRTWQSLAATLLVLILVAPTSASARKRLAKKKITKVMAGKMKTPEQPAAATPRKQASSLFAEANKMVSRGAALANEAKDLCLGAMARYHKAYSIFPSFKIDLNIGGTLDIMGRPTEAAVYFEKFLNNSQKAPPDVIKEAKARLEELRQKLASVIVNSPVKDTAVLINGEEVGRTPVKMSHYLEPGKYMLTVQKDGYLPVHRKLDLNKGDHLTLNIPLTSRAELEKEQRRLQQIADERRTKNIWGYTALAGAAALAVTAAVLYGVGAQQGISAHEGYQTTTNMADQRAYAEEVNSAKEMLIGGHVLIGLAAAAAGVSIYQLLTRPDAEKPAALPKAPPAAVGVFIQQSGAQFTLSGRF